ncbi:hypothetical protein EC988_006457, partial [Linderina pennispora]
MTSGNPILPSEPLALQPTLLAAAVVAEETSGRGTRSNSRARKRSDRRQFGRSESPNYTASPRRTHEHSEHTRNGAGWERSEHAYYAPRHS